MMTSAAAGTLDEAYERLHVWWPRLLPGEAAAATHGVIRAGHAVRALLSDGEDDSHLAELAHGLATQSERSPLKLTGYVSGGYATLPALHSASTEKFCRAVA